MFKCFLHWLFLSYIFFKLLHERTDYSKVEKFTSDWYETYATVDRFEPNNSFTLGAITDPTKIL